MTDHGQLAVARATTVNVAVASSHRSGSRTKIGARDIDQRFAKGRATGLVANEGREDVPFLQKNSASDADRLLAFANINATGDPATAIHTGEFLFEHSGQQHPAKRLEIFFVGRRFRLGFLLWARRLQHRTIVANIRAAAQKIFAFYTGDPEVAASPEADLGSAGWQPAVVGSFAGEMSAYTSCFRKRLFGKLPKSAGWKAALPKSQRAATELTRESSS